MELSQPLAIESFSHSWLTSTVTSPLDGLEDLLSPSFDSSHDANSEEFELNNKFLKLKRSTSLEFEAQNFDFDVPVNSECSESLVHADQLFSNGLIKPVYTHQSKIEASDLQNFTSSVVPCSSFSSSSIVPTVQYHNIFRRWRKASGRILQKCFGCLRPLCHKITGSRKSTRVDDIDRIRARHVKRWSNLPQASPYTSNNRCDIESSIYEAVLYCKESINE